MPDSLHLSLWFPDVEGPAMLPHILSVLQQFPFSDTVPGISYVSVQPVSWNEASVLERRFVPGVSPEEALLVAADLVHDDYAYTFDAHWDLWTPTDDGGGADDSEKRKAWQLTPSRVKFIARGEDFDEGAYRESGHIEVDFGLDSPFLQENVALTEDTQARVRDNVANLVEFAVKAEKNTRANSRLLWSESQENLAQKLVARLQRVQ
jgi:hypothetical protein